MSEVNTAPTPPGVARDCVDTPWLQRHFGVTGKTIVVWARAGLLPPPLLVSRRKKLWSWAQVEAHLARRQAQGRAPTPNHDDPLTRVLAQLAHCPDDLVARWAQRLLARRECSSGTVKPPTPAAGGDQPRDDNR